AIVKLYERPGRRGDQLPVGSLGIHRHPEGRCRDDHRADGEGALGPVPIEQGWQAFLLRHRDSRTGSAGRKRGPADGLHLAAPVRGARRKLYSTRQPYAMATLSGCSQAAAAGLQTRIGIVWENFAISIGTSVFTL